jgi:DNA-binding MarR family transcriptional regulator
MTYDGQMTSPATTPRWLDADEQAAWRAFLDMHARLTAQLNRELQEQSEISVADFSVLVQLSEYPGAQMRVLELARALRWEKSRLSHQLTRMQQRGLLTRSNCSEDRRGAHIVLTSHGQETVERAAPHHVDGVRRYLFDRLTAQQVVALADISHAVIDRLDTIGCEAPSAGCDSAADTDE